jgi:hypothetical protein
MGSLLDTFSGLPVHALVVHAVVVLVPLVAKESGEKLAVRIGGGPPMHMSLGRWVPLIAGALFALILVYWLVDRGIPLNRPRPLWLTLLGVALIIVALFAIFWTVRTGHTGSQAVWNQLLPGGG